MEVDEPNNRLYDFFGSIDINAEEEYVLTIDNFIHKGAFIRNTQFIFGLVLYTGKQMKIMMSATKLIRKSTKLEQFYNIVMVTHVIVWLLLGIFLGIYLQMHLVTLQKSHFIFGSAPAFGTVGKYFRRIFSIIFEYFLILPYYLYITKECVTIILARFLANDRKMYDPEGDKEVSVHAYYLVEELAYIDHIFSDKTGTLTRNQVVLNYIALEGLLIDVSMFVAPKDDDDNEAILLIPFEDAKSDFSCVNLQSLTDIEGRKSMESNPTLGSLSQVEKGLLFENNQAALFQNYKEQWMKNGEDFTKSVHSLLLSMALCNTITPYENEGKIEILASSTDEFEFVSAASKMSFQLEGRSLDECKIRIYGKQNIFEVLVTNQFTPERKRMSVVVRMPDGSIRLFIKGADEVISALSSENEELMERAEQFSESGLRVLMWAERTISDAEFDEWAEKWNEARLDTTGNKEERVRECVSLLEQNLRIIGVTGVLDKLQDHVPETIADLKKGGLKIWMLTGDKMNTAVVVAKSVKVTNRNATNLFLKVSNIHDIETNPDFFEEFLEIANMEECTLVVAGQVVDCLCENKKEKEFLHLVDKCTSVICFRATPDQKSRMVSILQNNTSSRVLAIGDGANDVSMINRAHVGVGIFGREGNQATVNADFALGQFSFLKRLLFLHGRWQQIRLRNLTNFLLYGNLLYVIFYLVMNLTLNTVYQVLLKK